ncbi:MAG: PEP-CTERM sorting domain-containing protein [Chthonomonas sp.]|nr:PEP-CTERM sorting domain-containing protein [Chthonomonas sp.]
MKNSTKLAFSFALLGSVVAAQADMSMYDSAATGPFKWSAKVGSGSAANGTMGGGHLNPTNDGFNSAESTPSTNPIERSWFYWKKGTSTEFALNTTTSSNSIFISEDTGVVGANVSRTLVVNQKDTGTGSQILQFTIKSTLIPGVINNTDVGASKAQLKYEWSIRNISTSAQAFSFYYMGDLMSTINGSSGNGDDKYETVLGGVGQSTVRTKISSTNASSSTIPTIYVTAWSASNLVANGEYSVGATPATRTKFTDTTASAALLNNLATPVTGNGALAYQYDLNLAAGASTNGVVWLGYNTVPEPASVAAIGLGLVALLARKRKK